MADKPLYFDLCVIGAGSAGLSVAAGAVQLGLDVALIEKGEMGGECLNTGCIPSKSMLAAAKAAHTIRTAGSFGINAPPPDIDFRAMKNHVSGIIRAIAPHDSQERFEGMGVKLFREEAAFINKTTVAAGPHLIAAKNFVIATGSRPVIPPIAGLDPAKILTNENIFALAENPDHLVIIGGGPIGIEMAQAHRRLGCRVTVLDAGSILPKDDPDMRDSLRAALREEGIRIYENIGIEDVEHREGRVIIPVIQGKDRLRIEGSHLLVAAGRRPNTDLALEKAGIDYDGNGIKTDKRLRTRNKKIYAAGDVTGGPQFTHIAGYHAGIIIRNMLFKLPAKIDYRALPRVTYTDPELAQAGLTEAEAREKYREIKISCARFKENDRAQTERKTEGGIKIIMEKSGRIIGASILGPHAGELIGLWSLAIDRKIKIAAIANMIAPYPTYGEISKRAAGSHFSGALFSGKTRFAVSLLRKLPF